MGEYPNKCKSCGVPMRDESEHGAGNMNNPYCVHCADANGNLKSREEIKAGMVEFIMRSQNKPRDEAEREADRIMSQQPAWQEQ